MITFNHDQRRRESYICGGWNIADDDLPHQPECDALDSAQRKRYLRETLCNPRGHQPAGSAQADQIGASKQGGDQGGQTALD